MSFLRRFVIQPSLSTGRDIAERNITSSVIAASLTAERELGERLC